MIAIFLCSFFDSGIILYKEFHFHLECVYYWEMWMLAPKHQALFPKFWNGNNPIQEVKTILKTTKFQFIFFSFHFQKAPSLVNDLVEANHSFIEQFQEFDRLSRTFPQYGHFLSETSRLDALSVVEFNNPVAKSWVSLRATFLRCRQLLREIGNQSQAEIEPQTQVRKKKKKIPITNPFCSLLLL